MGSFCPHRADEEEAPRRHLLPDGFCRVSLQGQLGCVGQSLLHCQITQQVVTLEGGNINDIKVTTAARYSSQLTFGSPACILLTYSRGIWKNQQNQDILVGLGPLVSAERVTGRGCETTTGDNIRFCIFSLSQLHRDPEARE